MTLISGIWSTNYTIIAADSRETHINYGNYQFNNAFNKILEFPSLAIGFAGESRFPNNESVIEFVNLIFVKYYDDLDFNGFIEELNNSKPFHEKPNTDIFIVGFNNNLPICIEYKISISKLTKYHELKDNGIIFNYNLDHPRALYMKGNIYKHFFEITGSTEPDFNELTEQQSINLLTAIYEDLIADPDFRDIGGAMSYFIFNRETQLCK